MSNWREIESFPGYSVNEEGVVRNDKSGRYLIQTTNQGGMSYVGISRDNIQYKRSVSALVARAFLDPPTFRTYTVTINLDGDRENNRVSNLMWRPLHFARRYHQQFRLPPLGLSRPIIDVKTHECFSCSWDAATKYGLIDRDLMLAILNRTCVFPTFQMFQILEE